MYGNIESEVLGVLQIYFITKYTFFLFTGFFFRVPGNAAAYKALQVELDTKDPDEIDWTEEVCIFLGPL